LALILGYKICVFDSLLFLTYLHCLFVCVKAERRMVEEVTVGGLIKKFNEKKTKPIFPSTFYASFSKTTKK